MKSEMVSPSFASSRADAAFRWPTVHTHFNEATMLVVELADAHARAAQDRARVAVDRVHLTRWAETFITARHPAIRAIGKPVKLEAAILCGPAGDALVSESRNAALICKSSAGIGARGLGKLIHPMNTPASTEPGEGPG